MVVIRGTQRFGADAVLLWQAVRGVKRYKYQDWKKPNNFSAREFALAIGMPIGECAPVLDAMVSEGWLSKASDSFVMHVPFKQFGAARVGTPITRTKAQELLRRAISEAKEINRLDPSDLPVITRRGVFGSYLDPVKEKLGDLDLVVETARRPKELRLNQPTDYTRERYLVDPVKKRLKTGSPSVSVHSFSEIQEIGARWQDVYDLEQDLPDLFAAACGGKAPSPGRRPRK